ncbi:MAG TPA: class I SAM-dependent methyltransferase [Burkholderiales bacterium]
MSDRVADTWERGDPYEQYVGRWSRQVAPRFLSWLAQPAGCRWLDVGCGTGALSAAILEHCAPARHNLAGRAALHRGAADALPLADASVDVVVSALVLNFVPDPRAALKEMRRVARSGGRIAAYVWDYAGKMELMRHFWDVAVELDASAARLDEGKRFPLCHPDALVQAFTGAGLGEAEVTSIDIPTRFASFEDYWQPFLGGQGPAPAYAMSLEESQRARLRDRLRQRLPVNSDGSIALVARAWAVKA